MYFAILFSIILLFLLLFLNHSKPEKIIESLTQPKYQPYPDNNPMILAEKNAANIEYLKGRLNQLAIQRSEFDSLEDKVSKNTDAIKQMSQLATQHITSSTGISAASGTPPSIKKLSSIGQNAGNYINPITSTTTHVTPSRPDPTAPLN